MTWPSSTRKGRPNYDALKTHIEGKGAAYSFLGHKHFWNSDFTVHQRPGYYASVKMNSAHAYGTEKLNGENLKGYWLPLGVTYIARRGDEYGGIFPAWDWARLPGVTNPDELPQFLSHVTQQSDFVVGVSDGSYGASAMQLDIQRETSIHAHKAWFFFDDEFVALGTDIGSTSGQAVSTTINQSLLKGSVVVDGAVMAPGQHNLAGVSWVLHDGIGYVFPSRTNAALRTGPRSASWSTINVMMPATPVTRDVFALWLDHGVRPQHASYQYIVVPDTDAARLTQYAAKPAVTILANTPLVQAVRHERLGTAELIFYAPGRQLVRKGLTIAVDRPCAVLVHETGGSAKLALASPRGPLDVHVSLELPSGTKTVTFDLRGGPALGASHVETIGEL